MKTAALIAEYNPFHNGHLYQLDMVRQTLGADFIIVVMSGDFTQRGEPAIIDKYERCRIALECGADAIFELPAYFALGSAEYFAQGAVSLIDKLGVADVLHFGSECGDIGLLRECADIIAYESDEYKKTLSFYLKEGKSFPLARSKAVQALPRLRGKKIDDIFSSPNNILALEYIKALKQRKSRITPLTLKRKGAGFNSEQLSENDFASAKSIRKKLVDSSSGKTLTELSPYLPKTCLEALCKNTLLFQDDFSQALLYRLMQGMNESGGFSRFYDVGNELSNVILSNVMSFSSFDGFARLCKSKNLTYTRVCRALMHILLDMTQENADILKQNDYCAYARLLGFREKNGASAILSRIRKNASIPIITSPAKGLRSLTGSAFASLKADIHAANIYEGIKSQKRANVPFLHGMPPLNEMTRKIIKINSKEILIKSVFP